MSTMVKNNKKKLAAGAVAGVAALALIGGGTFALWSDFTEVTGGGVAAGNLTLTATGVTSTAGPVGGITPGGASVDESFAVATNSSNSEVKGELKVTLQGIADLADSCSNTNSEAAVDDCELEGTGDLSAEADAVVLAKEGPCETGTFTVVNPASKLINYQNFPINTGIVLDPGEQACVKVSITLPADATDKSQGDSATFGARFDITQVL